MQLGERGQRVDDFALHDLLATVREQLPGQPRRAQTCIAHVVEVLCGLSPQHLDVALTLEVRLRQVGLAEHRRQDVVEVMGQASGQAPDGFELLGLAQPRLEVLALQEVALEVGERSRQLLGAALDLLLQTLAG